MNANKSGKRNAFSIADKLQILEKFDSRGLSETLKDVADSLQIPKTTLQTIVKNRDKIEASAMNSNVMRKKSKSSKFEDMEQPLIEWIRQARHGNIPLSGPIVRQKALEIAESFEIEDFTASTGWLSRFNKRYGIVYKQICGESESVNEEEWLNNTLPNYLKRYDPKNIFTVDEFGLFYKLTPDKLFILKHEKYHGGKLSEERITVLVGCNMDGSEKLKLLVIGKDANPRCFENVNKGCLLCDYENQSKAWMTGEHFKKWLQSLDQEMQNQNRKILLFVDNCPAHPKNLNLKNIEIAFFPEHSKCNLQPMDQGVIKIIKQFYRKRLVMRYLKTIDKSESENHITILDAINYISSSWDAIQQTTISNCFRKAGFNLDNNANDTEANSENYVENEFEQFGIDFEEYVGIDDDLVTSEIQSLEEIIQDNYEDNENDVDIKIEPESTKIPSQSEALDALDIVRNYLQKGNVDSNSSDMFIINSLENSILNNVPYDRKH